MDAIRQALGIVDHAPVHVPRAEHASVEERLIHQEAVIKAMDAQVDAQRTSATILHPHRRATDRRA